MKVRTLSRRGAPIHLSSGGHVISLVPEVRLRVITMPWFRCDLHLLSPSALYLIDDRGVERLRFGPDRRTLASTLALLALGPLAYRLIARNRWSK